MNHPSPALGSSQVKILKTLQTAGDFVVMEADRALEKLWKKGYIRWQSVGKDKAWVITKDGLEALERRGT